ncbi:hypothetical protein [Fervidobacterium thailandense]|uniref:Uncharacterized protein n=1 Tax=Fervidobacterium thailandense TaxID=1008305 RepID=A0A1E3G1W3_9BACT|nr:hypothetical protein [Fervidobacterium thailandense]ODN30140.1 hypothetical protein A4H02_06845 [Fervidobacterium thailandense]
MKRILVLIAVVLSVALFAKTVSIPVKAGEIQVPVVVKFSELLELLPEDFEPVWESLKVICCNREVPYQIDDVDGNNRISGPDTLLFLASGQTRIEISDVKPSKTTIYPRAFNVEKFGNGFLVKAVDGSLEFEVTEKGLVNIKKFGNVKADIVSEIGIARIAGWSRSTYYVDGDIGKVHDEETTPGLRLVSLKVLTPGPVAVGIQAVLFSDKFFGLSQELMIYVFTNGDILVNNQFKFYNYADIMKLQTMITRPMIPAFDDTLHILPVFRRLSWADQLGITPYEYWLERNAVTWVDKLPYIIFPAGQSMKPLFWGATYIFASAERWRTNYSPKAKMGVAEIMPTIPLMYADYKKWLEGDTWVYESLEFRTGIFKWVADEFNVYPATENVYPVWGTKKEEMPNRYKAGDVVEHKILYHLYTAPTSEEAIKWLERKSASFRALKIGE